MTTEEEKRKRKRIKLFITKITNSWVFTTGIGSTVLTVLFFIINIILNIVVKHNYISTGFLIFLYLFCALFSAVIAVAIFLFPAIPALRNYFIDDNTIKELYDSSVKNKEITNNLENIFNGVSENLKNITIQLGDITYTHDENMTKSNKIIEHFHTCSVGRFKLILAEDFFNHLDYARINAKQKLFLTSFSTKIYRANKNFLNDEVDYCRNKKNTSQVRRIITIHSEMKFILYKNMIENIGEPVDNLKIAYLDIDNLEDVNIPRIIGLQIIDDEVFIMNPLTARIVNPQRYDPNKIIIINDKETSEIFEKYYIELWDEIESSSEKDSIEYKKSHIGYKGYILYDGEKNYCANPNIWNEIYKRIPEKNKIREKD